MFKYRLHRMVFKMLSLNKWIFVLALLNGIFSDNELSSFEWNCHHTKQIQIVKMDGHQVPMIEDESMTGQGVNVTAAFHVWKLGDDIVGNFTLLLANSYTGKDDIYIVKVSSNLEDNQSKSVEYFLLYNTGEALEHWCVQIDSLDIPSAPNIILMAEVFQIDLDICECDATEVNVEELHSCLHICSMHTVSVSNFPASEDACYVYDEQFNNEVYMTVKADWIATNLVRFRGYFTNVNPYAIVHAYMFPDDYWQEPHTPLWMSLIKVTAEGEVYFTTVTDNLGYVDFYAKLTVTCSAEDMGIVYISDTASITENDILYNDYYGEDSSDGNTEYPKNQEPSKYYPESFQQHYPESSQQHYPESLQHYPESSQQHYPEFSQHFPESSQQHYPEFSQHYPESSQHYPESFNLEVYYGIVFGLLLVCGLVIAIVWMKKIQRRKLQSWNQRYSNGESNEDDVTVRITSDHKNNQASLETDEMLGNEKEVMLLFHPDSDHHYTAVKNLCVYLEKFGISVHGKPDTFFPNWRDFAEKIGEEYVNVVIVLSKEFLELCNLYRSRQKNDRWNELLEQRHLEYIPCVALDKLRSHIQEQHSGVRTHFVVFSNENTERDSDTAKFCEEINSNTEKFCEENHGNTAKFCEENHSNTEKFCEENLGNTEKFCEESDSVCDYHKEINSCSIFSNIHDCDQTFIEEDTKEESVPEFDKPVYKNYCSGSSYEDNFNNTVCKNSQHLRKPELTFEQISCDKYWSLKEQNDINDFFKLHTFFNSGNTYYHAVSTKTLDTLLLSELDFQRSKEAISVSLRDILHNVS